MHRRILVGLAVVAVLVSAALAAAGFTDEPYQVKILMPAADGTFVGGRVQIAGQNVGEVTGVGVLDRKALVTVAIDDANAPVRAGTTARVSWDSALGARVVELLPAPRRNPALPSGKMIVSRTERVELDDVFAMLDESTRKRVQKLLPQLRETLRGRERDVNETVQTAGPAVQALGEVMRAVGEDGPAIRSLVKRLRAMTGELSQRSPELAEIVRNLGRFTSATADEHKALNETLHELPPTIRQVRGTLDRVPGAVRAAVPLLDDLRPATKRLPRVARDLRPVLTDLRPTVADLRPTLTATRALLGRTPRLLDSGHAALPGVDKAVTTLQPAVAFLRPYTPEAAGWLSNWTTIFAGQNGNGNYARPLVQFSGTSLNENPGVMPPGLKQDPRPAPGSIVGQPWVDANGDGIR